MQHNVFDGWNDAEEMMYDFKEDISVLEGYNIVIACYDTGNYSGDAFVLLEKNGNYYEVNGSHCSCYGLEGNWSLEEVNEAALKARYESNYAYGGFKMALGKLEKHFGW